MTRANHQMLTERESEINHVVKSIQDLNELFKDLAVMIEDQGTIVDRIDYNIEKVSHSVQHGLTELEKASKYQKTSRKMYFIAFLIVLFLVLFILLVITKF
jgi:syntaxin 16